ncbi:unnamed protein product [Ectocarpus sp. CCAP 1310/34]|nr:unnamed protein product [Ectocarpus sp. CCAP 1310/34]
MHVQLEGECGWEKQHNLRTSGKLEELPVDERLELWCTERQRVPAQPLPPGFRLLEPREVMEVVYHDECAYKQNDRGGAAWENDEKGAAMSPKNEGAAVMVSDLIGEERGQLDIPAEVYAIMQEHGTMPKMEITDEGATLSRSDTYVGRCKPCEEYPDGMKTKKVSDAVHSLERVLSELNIDCKESGPEYNLARSARIILRVGKNLDGYWDSNRLCVQLEAIFAAFEISREPGRQMLAVFDNSTGHNAYSPDALRAQNIRASPGGEQIPPRNFEYNGRTIYTTFREGDVLCFRSSPFARKTEAEAVAKKRHGKRLGVFPIGTVVKRGTSSEKLIGVAKGMKEILEDMGLYKLASETKAPPLLCQRCKDEAKAKRDKSTMYNKGGESRQQALEGEGDSDDSDEDSEEGGARDAARTSRRCCCQRIISEVKAFKEQMNRVEELFEAAGHACIFLAKYHPELNAIERFWGYTKSIERRVCDYSVLSLLARLPMTLSTVSLSLCRKWARVSWLYIYAYSHGA